MRQQCGRISFPFRLVFTVFFELILRLLLFAFGKRCCSITIRKFFDSSLRVIFFFSLENIERKAREERRGYNRGYNRGKNLEQIIPIKEGLYVETHKYANICTVNNDMQRVKLVFLTIFCCLQQSMTRLDWCWHRSIIGKVYFSNTSCSFIFVNLDNQRFFFFFLNQEGYFII